MDKAVMIQEYKGEIVARMPRVLGKKASELRLGIYDPEWKCWRMRKSPSTAYELVTTFKDEIAHCDEHVRSLAKTYLDAITARASENLPDIPNMKTVAWQHQRQAYWFSYNLPGVIPDLDMGCISGDAKMIVYRKDRIKRMSLEMLHRDFWKKPNISWKCYSFKGDRFDKNEIKNVLYKGKKEVVKVTFEHSRYLVCTPDHEILSGYHGWVRADSLQAGDPVLACKMDFPYRIHVVSVEPCGEQDVYDVVMADPWRNFVANGIVVHNCGKSLVAVGLITNRPNDKVLIVCPKSVISVWPDEFAHSQGHFLLTPLQSGSVAKRQETAAQAMLKAQAKRLPCVIIINYESFWRQPMFKWILSQQWDQVVYDECHRTKDPTGEASKAASKLCKQATYRIGLTGTMAPHSPLDPFAQFRAVEPSIFGWNYYRHKMRYAEMGGFGGKQVVSYKNQEELAEKLNLITFRVSAEDVQDLPETIHTYRRVPLSAKTAKVYRDLDKELYAEIEEGSVTPANAMVKLLRLQQLTSGYLKTDEDELVQYGTEKKELLKEILTEIPAHEPGVVFCRFTTDIQAVKEVSNALGKTCAELSGNENTLKAWQDGEYDHIAVQVRSGGVGISLVRACYCVYYSIGHSLGDFLQSIKRTHRPGQVRPVRYFHMLAEATVDEKVYEALTRRKKVVDYVIDYYKQEGVKHE